MNVKPTISIIFSLLLIVFSCQLGFAQRNRTPSAVEELSSEQIAEKYLPAVVLVTCASDREDLSQGTGIFLRPGLILTNFHVIAACVRGKIKGIAGVWKGREVWIESISKIDSSNDLALLTLSNAQVDGTAVVNLTKNNSLKLGQGIYVLSNPEGLTGTISQGMVSGGPRLINGRKLLQIDAPISPGSSGGAVLDRTGKLVGVASGSLNGGQNLNFAVPILPIRELLDRTAPPQNWCDRRENLEHAWLFCRESASLSKQGILLAINSLSEIVRRTRVRFEQSEYDKRQLGAEVDAADCRIEYRQIYRALSEGMIDTNILWKANLREAIRVEESKIEMGMVNIVFPRAIVSKQVILASGSTTTQQEILKFQLDWRDRPTIARFVSLLKEYVTSCSEARRNS